MCFSYTYVIKMLKMFLLILFISYAAPGISIEKGKVVPHANELHKILSSQVSGFSASEPGSIIDFILNGNGNINPSMGLDTTVLDPSGIKRIVEKAWHDQRDSDGLDENALMWDMFPNDTPEHKQLIDKMKVDYSRRSGLKNHFGYQQLDVVANMALRQMRQSLYSTKERLENTAPFRKRYGLLPSYQVALYTALVNLNILRMDSYYLTMETWYRNWQSHDKHNSKKYSIHFLWYLIYYEKVLACNVEVTDTVRRVLTMHKEYMADNPAV